MSFWSDPGGTISSEASHIGDVAGQTVQNVGEGVLGKDAAGKVADVSHALSKPLTPDMKWDWPGVRDWLNTYTGVSMTGGLSAPFGLDTTQQIGGFGNIVGGTIGGAEAMGIPLWESGAAESGLPAGGMTATGELAPGYYGAAEIPAGGMAATGSYTAPAWMPASEAAAASAAPATAAAAGGGSSWVLPAVAGAGLISSKLGQKDYSSQMSAAGQPATAEGQKLLDQYNKGELNPYDQYQINQWQTQNIAAVKDLAARSGTSDSTMVNQQIGQIQQQAQAMKSQALTNMLNSGLNALQIGQGPEMAAIQAQMAQDQAIQQQQQNFFMTMAMWGAR